MQDLPIRNIFLPATLAASSIFLGLTLPAALVASDSSLLNQLPILNRSINIDWRNLHKDIAIPYIGTTVMLSAGAGVATAEIMRKRLTDKQPPAPEESSEAATPPPVSPAQGDGSFPGLPLTDARFEWPTLSEAESISQEPSAADSAPATLWNLAQPQPPLQAEKPQRNPQLDQKVVIFPGQYQRCRIQVPQVQEQLYAIEFNEQFYSLQIAGITKDEGLSAVEQLSRENQVAILTRMNQGYAVWVLEPDAQKPSAA